MHKKQRVYADYYAPFVEGGHLHIYNRGNNSGKVFFNDENNRYFLEKFSLMVAPYMNVYAFALMGNHFHFIVSVRTEDEIIAAAKKHHKYDLWKKLNGDVNAFLLERWQRFLGSYAQAVNRREDRTGSLFERRFKRLTIDTTPYWERGIMYVHHNPIHHGCCDNYEDWYYSSYNAYLSTSPTLINRDFVLTHFGGGDGFVAAHKQYKAKYAGKEPWDDEVDF